MTEEEKLYVCSGRYGVEIIGGQDIKDGIVDSDFPYRYIPSYSLEKESPENAASILSVPEGDFDFEFDIPDLILGSERVLDYFIGADALIERMRQENGMYSIHSSSIKSGEDGAAVFIGWRNSGKTGLSLQMCEEKDYKFISDGKTVIGSDKEIKKYIHNLESDSEFFYEKYGFTKDYNSIEDVCEVSKEGTEISMFVYPHITNSELEVERWDFETALYHFYEKMSHDIRNDARRFQFYDVPVPSLDTRVIAEKRNDFSKELAENVPVYELRGRPEELCQKVDELFKTL